MLPEHPPSDTVEFEKLLAVTDDDVANETGGDFASASSYLQREISALCSYPLLDATSEQQFGTSLPSQRVKIWSALREYPGMPHLCDESIFSSSPDIPTVVRLYRTIKQSLETDKDPAVFLQNHCCDRVAARESFDQLHPLYAKYMDDRQKLFQANGRMVVAIARRLQGLGLSLNDLLHFGVQGLLHAVDNFEWRGSRFSTYAYPCVRGHTLSGVDAAARTIRIPAHRVAEILALNRAEAALGCGAHGSEDELAAYLDWKKSKVKEIRQWRKKARSMDDSGEDGEYTLHDILQSKESQPDEAAIRSDSAQHAREVVEQAVADIMDKDWKPRERKGLTRALEAWRMKHTGEGMRVQDIAAVLGVSVPKAQERIRYIGRLIEARIRDLGQAAHDE